MSDGIILVLADVVSDKKPHASIFTDITRILFVYLVRNPVGFGIILGLLTLALIVTGFVFYSKRKAQRNNESVNGIKQWVLKILHIISRGKAPMALASGMKAR